MITGSVDEAAKYYCVNPHFREAFEVLKSFTPDACENYKSDNISINISEVVTSDLSKNGKARGSEAHRKYIDIHYIIDGAESIGYANIKDLKAKTDYCSNDDYQLFEGEVSKIRLNKGDFCITFPEDAHVPFMNAGKETKVKRCVVKIAL